MKVWVYVEGKSDKLALSALWRRWKQDLGGKGWGIEIVPLENKSKYFESIGARATEKLVQNEIDLVVGLPDLYPNRDFVNTRYRHSNLSELQRLQIQLVKREVRQKAGKIAIEACMNRFYASALKHDLEMLLLAVPSLLQSRLGTKNVPRNWRQPPENQNQSRPPKRIVEGLFQTRLKRSYREITDSKAILGKANLSDMLFDRGHEQCPTFRVMLDWLGEKTGVQAY